MATLNNNYPTLADLAKQMDGKGDVVSDIIEILNDTNNILADMPFFEANNGTKHLTTIRSGIPTATWRRLYAGVQPQKSTNTQVEDTCGMLEAWSEVDSKLIDLSGNPARFRMNEARAFLEGMNRQMATAVFYGNTDTDPEQFNGLAPRFDSLSADNGAQIIDGGGSGSDNTSMWMVVWGERTCHGIYPKGSKAGLGREDKGKTTKEVSDGSLYDVHREKFIWDCGLSVRDWRYVVRIANIDVSDMLAGSVDMFALLRKGYWQLKQRQMSGGRAAIYANSDVLEALDAQSTPTVATSTTTSSGNVRYGPMDIQGKEVMGYRGMPLRECDALLNTEARVV
jgi:hypothetical protein